MYAFEFMGLWSSPPARRHHGQDIRLACAIGLPFGIYFSIFNLTHGFTILGIIEGVSVLFFLPLAYFLSGRERMTLLAESLVLLCVTTIFLALFHYGGISGTGIYWIFSLPLTAFYVAGQFRGWLWSFALLVLIGIVQPFPGFTKINLLHSQLALLYYTAISASFNMLRTKYSARLHLLTIELTATLKELRETQAQIAQSEKMAAVGQLVAGVAHEVNNTTNFISGALPPLGKRLAELVLLLANIEADGAPKLKKIEELKQTIELLLGNIREGARRTCKIVTDLKNFSRLYDDLSQPLDINEGLETTLALVTPEYKYKMEVIREFSADLPVVYGSQGQLNQVFMNIIINAFQAQPNTGCLLIRTFRRKDTVHILFKDDGPGIPQEIKNRIFEPFFTTKEVGVGTGLGLSVSFGITNKHRGRIMVRSEPGQGAEFEVILPAGPDPNIRPRN
ncbi:MAG: hypothetical protein A2512_09420 [Deltaproteobacteria bacterium RIFOXYD12_FULL_56_24]|nr:MAG: hypothetical protein A2512_09420 [Deltaproteobacteria bacterium RIFOXYD12_FULL_56_24]